MTDAGGAVINVGVVGLGQGRSHLSAFQHLPRSRVTAVADLNPDLRARIAHDFEIPTQYETIEQLLDDASIDLVVIATPDHMHGRHAIAALEAGKHVLSEIPMATSLAEVRRIVELTKSSSLKYHMGNQVRYANCLRDVKRLIADGDMGEIFYGEGEYLHNMEEHVHRREKNHWRMIGDTPQTTLLGGGPHALDTTRWLMGVEFTKTAAFHSDHKTQWGTTHNTVAIFHASSGATAKVTTGYGMIRPYCLYFSAYGTEGSFERSRDQGETNGLTTNYLYHNKLGTSQRMIPVTLSNFSNPDVARLAPAAGHGTMEYEQARDFLQAVIDDTEPVIGPSEAAKSIVPLICALQSADQGGGLIEIPDVTV
jgi:predicted dehydrogenase